MSKIGARAQRSRKKLADALISLSLERGYENLTIAAVAKRAQVAHSTIYRHYKSLDDLLIQILQAMLQVTEKRIAQHLNLYDEAVALYTCVKEQRKLYCIYAALPLTNPVRQIISADFAKLMEARCEQRAQMQAPFAVSAEHALDVANRMIHFYSDKIDEYTPEQIASMHCNLVVKGTDNAGRPGEMVDSISISPVHQGAASSPTKSTMNPKAARSRQKLADALCSLVPERGYDNVSIAAVTTRAKVGYATFFRHYESLDDLLNSILLTVLQELQELLAQHETLQDQSVATFSYIKEHQNVFRLYTALPPTLPICDVIMEATIDLVLERYQVPEGSPVPQDMWTNHIVGTIQAFLRWHLAYNADRRPDEVAAYFVDLILATAEPRAQYLGKD